MFVYGMLCGNVEEAHACAMCFGPFVIRSFSHYIFARFVVRRFRSARGRRGRANAIYKPKCVFRQRVVGPRRWREARG